ncbi:MAG TPA: GDSL-type esterase/lipase family protein [Acidimicrobiia bacterium]
MSEPESQRRARLDRARVRRRRGTGAATAVLVVVVAMLGVGWWRNRDTDSSPAAARIATSTTTRAAGSVASKVENTAKHKPPRALTAAAPLKLWVGGDSLAGELGPSLGNELAPTGIVKTIVDFKVGSGLNNNVLRNWPERIPTQMSEYSPDVAIFMIGANDASIVGSDTAAWEPAYRAKVSEMMDLLGGTDHHRTVYWVGPPTMGSSSLDRGAKALTALMADEATHHPHVVFVNAYSMFSGPDGGYSSHLDLPALHRTDVLVRIGDGVHFTDAGAQWIAYNMAKLLDAQWQITNQAGNGAALSVTIESGGGSIPGGYRPTYTYRQHYYPTTASPSTVGATAPPPPSSSTPTTVGKPPTSSSTPKSTVSTPPSSTPHTSPPTT